MLALAACGPAGPAAPLPVQEAAAAELLTADREFAQATAENGLEGWMSFFAADAVRLEWKGAAHRGLAAIRAADGPLFADPAVRLTWEPEDAGLLAGGRLGYTRGPYRLIRLEDGRPGPTLARGRYLSLWQREPGGWRVILDTGVADGTAPPQGTP